MFAYVTMFHSFYLIFVEFSLFTSGIHLWRTFFVVAIFIVHVVSIADQEERTTSVEQFRKGEKDVLVATDVASKGLDFPEIKHVINYDMPEDIENYGKEIS